MVEAYLQVAEDLLFQTGGHYELNEITPPAFQQFITDLMILDLVASSYKVDTGLSAFVLKIVNTYSLKKKLDPIIFKFSDQFYLSLLKTLVI